MDLDKDLKNPHKKVKLLDPTKGLQSLGLTIVHCKLYIG